MTVPADVLAAVRSIPHPRQEPTMTAPHPSPAGLSPLLDQLDEAPPMTSGVARVVIRDLTAALRAVLGEHRPMANSPGRVPACPDCLGGIYADDPDEARSCGCWGLSTPVCSSCADRDGARLHPVQWPCPTVQALTAALTPGADTAAPVAQAGEGR